MLTLQDRPIIRNREEPRAIASAHRVYDEEVVNAVTHGIGLVLSIPAAVVLIHRAISEGDAWHVAGCSIFAATLIVMYAASTLSHSLSRTRLRQLFRSLDQAAIYLLIVGTYTPFSLTYLRIDWWLPIFGLMWLVALWGCVSKVLWSHRLETATVWSYILLAWTPIVAGRWLFALMPAGVFWWMLAGGLFYTVGTFFVSHDHRRPYFHALWHVFVMAGSACHYFAILTFVALMPPALL